MDDDARFVFDRVRASSRAPSQNRDVTAARTRRSGAKPKKRLGGVKLGRSAMTALEMRRMGK